MTTEAQVEELHRALAIDPVREDVFATTVPDGWQQGRGAFGGLVLGLLARAVERSEEDPERRLRTLSGEIVAPVLPGAAELQVERVRRGNGVSSLDARLVQEGEVRAHASALLAKARAKDHDGTSLVPPNVRPWGDVEPVPVEPPFGPHFARWYEYRPTGPLPFSGGTEAYVEGYVRARHRLPAFGAPEVIAHVDAWWPTLFTIESTNRPMATVSFNVQLFVDPSTLSTEEPLFHRARMLAAHDGYFMELRELWTTDGRLVALNPQTFAVIR